MSNVLLLSHTLWLAPKDFQTSVTFALEGSITKSSTFFSNSASYLLFGPHFEKIREFTTPKFELKRSLRMTGSQDGGPRKCTYS